MVDVIQALDPRFGVIRVDDDMWGNHIHRTVTQVQRSLIPGAERILLLNLLHKGKVVRLIGKEPLAIRHEEPPDVTAIWQQIEDGL